MEIKYNSNKLSFKEMISNSNGKTSGSGTIGFYLGLICGISFLIGSTGWYFGVENSIEFLSKSIQLGTLSALLLGVRKALSFFNKQ